MLLRLPIKENVSPTGMFRVIPPDLAGGVRQEIPHCSIANCNEILLREFLACDAQRDGSSAFAADENFNAGNRLPPTEPETGFHVWNKSVRMLE